jgi:hypothetical protein
MELRITYRKVKYFQEVDILVYVISINGKPFINGSNNYLSKEFQKSTFKSRDKPSSTTLKG